VIASLKPKKVTVFNMILHNSENNIRYIRAILSIIVVCHGSVVKYASSLLP